MEQERIEIECKTEDPKETNAPAILDELQIEELAVDGICGIY